ncbi:hypothetical protein K438DRAFT_1880539 [Mycena galopus ATCC 62051]|nr:hypothetical protein K438DRAFT_1880539 [Mycena galopus ATCC 62051]
MPDGLPRAIIGVRDSTPLSKCAATCHNAAGAAVCPDLATTCQCTNANFRSDFLSCVQGECQAAELDNAQQFVAGLCGTVSLSAKPTATVPFLPTNPNADINEPSHTRKHHRNPQSPPAQTSQETGSPNTGSTQTVHGNGAPAGDIVASVVIVVLIIALVIFVWWWIRRRNQRIRERRVPAQFLASVSPVQRAVRMRSPSIIKVAAATDVEKRAEVARTTMAQKVMLDGAQPEEGAPARTHNLPLINFSDVPAEENAAPASNAQDAAHTEEAVTVRLRRVEAQLAALLTPAIESPEELPPSYYRTNVAE